MKHLAKYIKRYLPLILLAIVLLFVQANADLALPDYLSNIVNVGIQQGGVANAIPQAIRQSTMDKLELFLTPAEKTSLLGDYTLADKNSANYSQLLKKYPALANEPIYILNNLSTAQINQIDPIMGRALLTVSFIELAISNPSKAATYSQGLGLNLSDLSSGSTNLGTGNTAAVMQIVAQAIKNDYITLGMNTNNLPPGAANSPVPIALSQLDMQRLTLFMSPVDKTSVLANYTLVDKNSSGYAQYVKEFPALTVEPVYVLNTNAGQTQLSQLAPIMAKAIVMVSFFEQVVTNPTQVATMAQSLGFSLSSLSGGTSAFGALDPSMINQAAAAAVKAEYTAIGMDVGKVQMDYMLNVGSLMLLVTLLSGACTISVSYLAARTAAGFGRDVRRGVFKKVTNFSNAEFDKFSTASLITRSTNDITQIQMVVFMIIRMVFYAPLIAIGGIIRALGQSTSMWWIIAAAVGILLTLIIAVFNIALPKFQSIQNLIDRLNLVIRENLAGMMVIRAFNRQDFEKNRFDKANLDLTAVLLFIQRVMVIMMPVMMLIMNGVTVMIIWIGSHQVADGNLQVGSMIAFMQYTIQIVFAFLMLSMMFIILPRAQVSANRLGEVVSTETVINDPANPKKFSDKFKGLVEFRNVSFRYPDAEEDVLHDISFTAQPGQTTALIGSTGSGKSTVINLIPRFYDVTEGSILLDNIDVREVTQHDLREKIGYIPQKGILFSGTIGDNLRFANENASLETLREAADIAQVTEFITGNGKSENHGNGNGYGNGHSDGKGNGDGKDDRNASMNTNGDGSGDGFEAEVAQGGMNYSGGQKQRLSIARALVRKAPIYIFDDSFSSVDFKTDAALRRALKQKTAGSTILIVTQRVSTIMNADQIIVLDEGRIIGKGTHEQLMRECKAYEEIAKSQLSQEELL
jgi:ATP-binding cassette subfamily B multidrug efflux pump